MRIIVDIDGVVADFVWAFTDLVSHGYPEVKPRHTKDHMSGWSFDDIPGEVKKKAWTVIMQSKTWWQTLPALGKMSDFNALDELNHHHDVYFITAREGQSIKLQSEKWLRGKGISRPSVIVVASGKPKGKVPVIEAIQPDIVVDDHSGLINVLAQMYPVNLKMPALILQDQPYNRNVDMERLGYRAVDLTETVAIIHQIIKKDKENEKTN